MSDNNPKTTPTKVPTPKVAAAPKVAATAKATAAAKTASAPIPKVAAALKKVNLKEKKKRLNKPRNYDLGNGIYRFSRSRMYHKKAIYKFINKKTPKKEAPKSPVTIVKNIDGDKNGKTRTVLLKKRRANYPTINRIKPRPAKKCFKDHTRYLRPTLKPGTVLIILAGPHKGKRVVLLKQLKSGLLLITGPFLINACPLRRINQIYVIATSTKINLNLILPKHINDKYFKRKRDKRAKKEEGDIFAVKKGEYKPSDQRKIDQKVVDKLVIDAIKKSKDRKMLFAYLATMFGLRSSQYPHRMKF